LPACTDLSFVIVLDLLDPDLFMEKGFIEEPGFHATAFGVTGKTRNQAL
jgi:hypothetical protein